MTDLIKTTKDFIEECWQGTFDEAVIPSFIAPHCIHKTEIGKVIGLSNCISSMGDSFVSKVLIRFF